MFVFREVRERAMDHRLIQPASRDQIVAIIRQRAERANRDLQPHLGQVSFKASTVLDHQPYRTDEVH
jgi:hypothetical protein